MNFVNPQLLCEASEDLCFELDLNKCDRACDLISSMQNKFLAKLHFFKQDNKFLVEGSLLGDFNLTCQRCLEDFEYNLNLDIKWNLVKFVAERQEEYEDFDFIELDENRLNLTEVLQDELIMALPFVPICDKEDCKLDLSAIQVLDDCSDLPQKATLENSPFAVLQNLKIKS